MSVGALANPSEAAIAQKLQCQAHVRSAAGWFAAIAAFSVVNSVLVMTGAKLHFIVGLGITTVTDVVATRLGPAAHIAAMLISLFMAALFTVVWQIARNGRKGAFIFGMVVYGLDGLLFIPFGLFLEFAFHCFALYRIYAGVKACAELAAFEAAANPNASLAAMAAAATPEPQLTRWP